MNRIFVNSILFETPGSFENLGCSSFHPWQAIPAAPCIPKYRQLPLYWCKSVITGIFRVFTIMNVKEIMDNLGNASQGSHDNFFSLKSKFIHIKE